MGAPSLSPKIASLSPIKRIATFLGLLFAGGGLWIAIFAASLFLLGQNPLQGLTSTHQAVYMGGLYLYLFALSAWFWFKVEGSSLPEVGLKLSFPNLLGGTLLGLGMILLLRFIEIKLGLVEGHHCYPSLVLLSSIPVALLVPVGEEFIFRGIILQTLLKGGSSWKALLLSGAFWSCSFCYWLS
jgi:membrane protease YdiL (CAAX protease family)